VPLTFVNIDLVPYYNEFFKLDYKISKDRQSIFKINKINIIKPLLVHPKYQQFLHPNVENNYLLNINSVYKRVKDPLKVL